MNIADVLVRQLQSHGVPHLYALCGNGLDPLLEAARRQGFRVIDVRNEQAAAYMADATGRFTRGVGAAAVSSGVAHLNAMTGVGNAWFDGSPMLLITGASDSATRGRGNFQDMETADLARPLCKYSDYVDGPERLSSSLPKALSLAREGRPGPVHLTIPVDVLRAESADVVAPVSDAPAFPEDSEALDRVVALIQGSQTPLIIAGSGVFYAGAGDDLVSLSEVLKAPVMVPIWDRGAIDRVLPQYCGVIGAASGSPDILGVADLILMVGAEQDYRVGYLSPPAVRQDARIISLDPSMGDTGQDGRGIALHGDLRGLLLRLNGELGERSPEREDTWLTQAQVIRDAFYDSMLSASRSEVQPSGRDVVEGLKPTVTPDTHVLVDGGNIGQWFHMIMNDRYPANWMTCGRSAVVGWGFPAAAAVSSLRPGGRVLLLSGDGAATFTIAEIEAAVRQHLPYVAVIADDSAWGIVVSGSNRRGQAPVASQLGEVRFADLATALGARGLRIDDVSQLPAEVERGFESGEVTILHVPIRGGGPADSL